MSNTSFKKCIPNDLLYLFCGANIVIIFHKRNILLKIIINILSYFGHLEIN